ncbi:septum formation family protein [Demequina subtropica]|uniref:septum formation family protein n=1 Tax=Demequina subtropica TaxID=1638989 RepID=UPI000784F8A4|nr:septum formation family protein [Demequina subtropica]
MTDGFVPPPTLGEDGHAPGAATRSERSAPRPAPRGPRRRGRRLAWIVGGAAALAIAGGVVADVTLEASARAIEPAQRGDTGRMAAVAVVPGICLEDLPAVSEPAGSVTAVACDEPHLAEAVAERTFTEEAWPGDDAVAAAMLDFCPGRVARIVPAALADGLSWRAWAPSEASWKAGDRTGVCVVTAGSPLTGSLERGTAERR